MLLVKTKNKTIVEYSLKGYMNPIGVAGRSRFIQEYSICQSYYPKGNHSFSVIDRNG
ncbi:MAG: hypothetical protein ACOYPR_18430 [Saprospiraceae bacterium]